MSSLQRWFDISPPGWQALPQLYDPTLVLASVVVAVLSSILALRLAGESDSSRDRLRSRLGVVGGATVFALGVWSMHFIGMLSVEVCRNIDFNPGKGILSVVPVLVCSWLAFRIARPGASNAHLALASLTLGSGIGLMHYGGVLAMDQQVHVAFDPAWFAVSIGVAVGFSAASLGLRRWLEHMRGISPMFRAVVAGLVLGIAVSTMHYVGMRATEFLAPVGSSPFTELDSYLVWVVAGSALMTGLTFLLGMAGVVFRRLYLEGQDRERRLNSIIETAPDGVLICDAAGVILQFSPSLSRMLGHDPRDVIGQPVSAIGLHITDLERRARMSGFGGSHDAGESDDDQNTTLPTAGGHSLPIRLAVGRTSSTAFDRPLFVAFVSDISSRMAIEQEIRETRALHDSFFQNQPGVALRYRRNSRRIVFLSEGIKRLTGRPPSEFERLDHHLKFIIDFRHINRVFKEIDAALAAAGSYSVEYPVVADGGQTRWLRETGRISLSDQGEDIVDAIIVDVTESKSRNAEFEGYARAIDCSLAVISFDLQGTIIEINQNFLDILGYSREDLVGKPHRVLCDPQEQESDAYRQLWASLRLGQYRAGAFRRIGKGGREVLIQGSYNPILDSDGRPYRIVKFASDITDRHQMEIALRDAKNKAESAAKTKSAFLANMSHELRTPMNAILGFTNVLLEAPDLDGTHREHVSIVKNSAQTLLGLLNDVLDTAKLEHGSMKLEAIDFSMRNLLHRQMSTQKVTARAKNLELSLDYPPSVPDYFVGDPLRIGQVITNLVGNALKFTEQGSVTIIVAHAGDRVRLSVKDTGIGIPPDRIDAIFDPFSQADASTTRRFGGTGLGTTISKQLVELMNGRIWAESEVGHGSTFHIELPLALGRAREEAQVDADVSLPPLRLLAVDDVPLNLKLLLTALKKFGHEIVTASDGKDAIDKFNAGPRFDAILMDVQMPVLDGLQATRMIRELEQQRDVQPTPIVALSAGVLAEDQRMARDSGMDAFVGKPVQVPELNRVLRRLLQLGEPATAPDSAFGERP